MNVDGTDYGQRIAARPQPLTLEQAAYKTPPTQLIDTEGLLDIPRLRAYRLNRLREQISAHDYGAIVLFDPLSIRYATGVRNCALYQTHIHAGYLFVPVEGPVVYFEAEPGRFTGAQLETIDEVRSDVLPLSYMFAGYRLEEWWRNWARQISDLIDQHCAGLRRLGVDKGGDYATHAFEGLHVEVGASAGVMAAARAVKSPEEILCMNCSIAVAEDGMTRMRSALRPGVTEVEIWSLLWQANIQHGGEWIEYRLLSSGDRTNPWQQEASSKTIRPGELLVFDCGMIGPFGYGADVSRAFFCKPGTPSRQQKLLYSQAHAEVQHNTELLQAGARFREIVEKRYIQPNGLGDQPYPCMMHGIGMGDEWPVVYYPQEEQYAYDGELKPGMVMCVESYVGEVGGHEGVKLENMVLVTSTGPIILSRFPFEDELLFSEI